MAKSLHFTLAFVAATCLILFVQGCNNGDNQGSGGAPNQVSGGGTKADAHAALHKSKYNDTLVEFPGHKYAMEIIDEKETTGLVTAFLTDAHFDPVIVDTAEVRLNFTFGGGSPKVFTLKRTAQEEGKPATFTLTDMELATLNCEGWEGEATASVVIGGVPYTAKMVKLGEHDHDH